MSFFPEIKLKGMTSFMDFMTTKKTSFPDKSFIQLLPPFAFMKIYVQVSCSTKQVNYCHSALHLLHEPAIFVVLQMWKRSQCENTSRIVGMWKV